MTFVRFEFDRDTLKKFSTHTITAGILMFVVGFIGAFMPSILSLVVVTMLSWLFVFSAIVQGYITYKTYTKSFSAWLKPVLSFIAGLLLVTFPMQGVASVAILLSAYLLVDAFSSFGFALDLRPNSGWWIHIINSMISIILAILIVTGWPNSSFYWVGLYAAISLLFDGIALILLGYNAKKL
jgi:uncharacterized membrane protein HdeD (DUF308 family)